MTSFLSPTFLIKDIRKDNRVSVLRFKRIKFDRKTDKSLKNLNVSHNRHIYKIFAGINYIYLTGELKWNYVLYIDINMSIHHDINPILDIKPINKIFARADGFPEYSWKLSTQFDETQNLQKIK